MGELIFNGESYVPVIYEKIEEINEYWNPPSDFLDIKNILDNDTEVYNSKIILLVDEEGTGLTFTLNSFGLSAIKFSDGAFYNTNGTFTHSFDSEKDIVVNGNVRRWYILYFKAEDELLRQLSKTMIMSNGLLWVYFKGRTGAIDDVFEYCSKLQAVSCHNTELYAGDLFLNSNFLSSFNNFFNSCKNLTIVDYAELIYSGDMESTVKYLLFQNMSIRYIKVCFVGEATSWLHFLRIEGCDRLEKVDGIINLNIPNTHPNGYSKFGADSLFMKEANYHIAGSVRGILAKSMSGTPSVIQNTMFVYNKGVLETVNFNNEKITILNLFDVSGTAGLADYIVYSLREIKGLNLVDLIDNAVFGNRNSSGGKYNTYGNSVIEVLEIVPESISVNLRFNVMYLSESAKQSLINGYADLSGLDSKTLTIPIELYGTFTSADIDNLTNKNITISTY